jgi:hypothetical protein
MKRKPPFALVRRTPIPPKALYLVNAKWVNDLLWIGLTMPDHTAIKAACGFVRPGDELWLVHGEGEVCDDTIDDFGDYMLTMGPEGSNVNWSSLTEHLPKG